LNVSTNVKIAMQCLENFGGQMPPLVARLEPMDPWQRLCFIAVVLNLSTHSYPL